MSAPRIRWKRADDGFVESHDGQWRITPLYCGSTRPQDYQLWRGDQLLGSMIQTQRESKELAEEFRAKLEANPDRVNFCKASKDGECAWKGCPQLAEDEPTKSGRHCPLDRGCSYCLYPEDSCEC